MPPVRFAGMAEDPEPHRNTAPNISYESASIPANDNLSSEADPAIHAVRQAISIDEMPDHDRLKGLFSERGWRSVIADTSSQSDRRKKMATIAAAKFREETSNRA